jgi:hypothetical protein
LFGGIVSKVYIAKPLYLFANDSAVARRALAGEPITILPSGKFYRWDEEFDVTDEVLAEFVENWEKRAERGIRQTRLAVDVDHDGKAVGWYESITATPDGLAATFSWNESGQRSLENGEYAYFSPTIWWQMRDRVTNEMIRHQIAGGALTNYPYFGDATALYSARQQGGITMAENLQPAGDSMLQQFWAWVTKQAANASDPDAPPMSAPPPEGFSEMQAQMEEYGQRLADLNDRLETVTGERDDYRQQVENLSTRLTSVQDARESEHFNVMAETYAHLPVALPDLAGHLRWLYSADREDEQPHASFFAEVLRKADAQFAAAFAEQGVARGSTNTLKTVEAAVAQYMQEHAGTDYETALSTVMRERPDLYQAYQREQQGG